MSVDSEFVETLDRDVQNARSAGASDEQIATLERARETGEITFDDYSEAVDRALRCMRELDIAVHDEGTIEHLGLRLRFYSVPREAEEADRAEPLPGSTVHRCLAEHSFWVEMVYQLQPSSVDAGEAHFERYRAAIVTCLHNYDIEVAPDFEHEELVVQFGRDEELRNTYGLCLDETGYSR